MIGLFAISYQKTRSRTKEIGIRKINGAKTNEILAIINKDFVRWTIIAFILAAPVALYAMNKWLENYAYKTEVKWWIIVLSGIIVLAISLLTVSWQSWRAATTNPVQALRYE
jgi:putative ABC transport system permease protein